MDIPFIKQVEEQMFKLMGITFIFLGCMSVGLERIRYTRARIYTLRDMEHSFILFKGMAETYRMPLEWICERIIDQVQSPVSDFYTAIKSRLQKKEDIDGEDIWKKCIKHMGKAFDKEDQMLFLHLGAFLGIQDVHMQNEVIDNYILQVRHRIDQLEKERPVKEKLYRVLSMTVSGLLILLFI